MNLNAIDAFVAESNRIEGITRPPLAAEVEALTFFLLRPRLYVQVEDPMLGLGFLHAFYYQTLESQS